MSSTRSERSCSVWPFATKHEPGKNALLPGTTAAFPSATEPSDFAVWCPLVASRRPYMRFMFISPPVFPSLPPPDRLPFQSWLFTFSRAVLLQGTCTPFTTRPCWAHTSRWSLQRAGSPHARRATLHPVEAQLAPFTEREKHANRNS